MSAPIYLDHNTATRPFSAALKAYFECHEEHFASTMSPHKWGQKQIPRINQALGEIYELLGGDEGYSFLLTSGGAESVAQVLYNTHFLQGNKPYAVVTTACEDAPLLLTLEHLEKRREVSLTEKGQLIPEALERLITDDVQLVSLSWAHGLTGVIHPIEDLVEVCKKKDVRVHLDVTTVLGKLFFRLSDLAVDYLTFDGARLCAPKGIGGLFVNEKTPFKPLILGREPSTNPPGMVALATAMKELTSRFDLINLETARMRDLLECSLKESLPDVRLLFSNVERLPNTSVVSFPGVSSEALLFFLNEQHLFASIGGGLYPRLSHLLTSCGVDEMTAQTALSFSLSTETTQEEIERGVNIISNGVATLQKTSEVLR